MKKVLTTILICFLSNFEIDLCFAQTLPNSPFVKELEKQFINKLTQAKNPTVIKDNQKKVDGLIPFVDKQNLRIDPSSPNFTSWAKEVGLGGRPIPEALEQYMALIGYKEIEKPLLAAYPPARLFSGGAYKCQPKVMYGPYWCGGCIKSSRFLGCITYGIAPANYYFWSTQLATVSTDSGSSPISVDIIKKTSADLRSGKAFNIIPGVGSLIGQIGQTAEQIFSKIQYKDTCIKSKINETLMKAAMSGIVAKKSAIPVDLPQELSACIMKANLDFKGLPKSEDYQKAGLPKNIASALAANMYNKKVASGSNSGERHMDFTLAASPVTRMAAKALENKLKYPSFRIYIIFPGHVTVKPKMDPFIIHGTKEPSTVVPDFKLVNLYDKAAQKAEPIAFANRATDSISDVGSSIYLAPQMPASTGFNMFNHILDHDRLIPLPSFKMPINLAWGQTMLFHYIDPSLAKFVDGFSFSKLNPYYCENLALNTAYRNSIQPQKAISSAFAFSKKLAMLQKFGISGNLSKITGGINKLVNQYQDESNKIFSKVCGQKSGANYKMEFGATKGSQIISPVVKTTGPDVAKVIDMGVRSMVNISLPNTSAPGAPVENQVIQADTNPFFYQNNFSGGSSDELHDLIQPMPTVEEKFTGLGTVINYGRECRNFDVKDSEISEGERIEYPGKIGRTYMYYTAFAKCPEFSPISPKDTFFGFNLAKWLSLVLSKIKLPIGGVIDTQVKPFEERQY